MTDQPMTPSGHPVAQLCHRLGARLDEVGDPGLWSVGDAELAELVRGLETQLRRLQAWQTKAVAEARRRDLAKTVGATGPTAWLAGTLTARPGRARQISALAAALDRGLDATVAAFGTGRIDADQARVIAEAVQSLPADVGEQVRATAEAFLLEHATTLAAHLLAGLAAHVLDHIAPDVAEAAEAEAMARADARDSNRANTFTANPDHRGRIRLRGELDPQSWALVSAALEPFAKPDLPVQPDGLTEQDHRTAGQRNADALVEICRRTLAADETPTSFGFPAHIAVTIGYDQLKAAVGVGTLDTGTPISAEDIRRYACDATVLPVLLNSTGVPLDVGRAIRVFTKELRRAVELRDLGCAFPGCDRPPSLVQRAPHHPLGRRRTHQPRQRGPALSRPPHRHPPSRVDRPPRHRPTTRVHPTDLDRPRPAATSQHRTPPLLRTRCSRHMSREHQPMRV